MYGPQPANNRRRITPVDGIILGFVGLSVAGLLTLGPTQQAHAYAADPTCAAAFALRAGRAGACRLARARILDNDRTSGVHGSKFVLVLGFPDGSSDIVRIAELARGNVWQGALRDGDRSATVQYFHGRPVQVETRSGLAIASAMPVETEKKWALLGLCVGVIGLISAAFAILTSGIF
jgi:hypothetical protein